jgi:predicted nucleic acid-binding protein
MILVDTSVLIQFLRGDENDKVTIFERLIKDNQPFGISVYTYAEVLQGARDDREYRKLDAYLSTQRIFEPNPGIGTFREAASVYYTMKRKGFTLRGFIDVLIALTATHNNLTLLHRDRDFEHMKGALEKLKTL